jgi:DNA/RNA endonuclease YhcR with UshA esterase domain
MKPISYWLSGSLLLVGLIGSGGAAQVDGPATRQAVIDATDDAALRARMNQAVIVRGTVARAEWSRSGKVMNIDFEGAGENGLMAVVFERNRKTLDTAFGGDLAKALGGAEVRIDGEIKPYGGRVEAFKDRPQIIIERVNQITIVRPAGTQPSE